MSVEEDEFIAMDLNSVIILLQKRLHIKLSPQQLKIIKFDIKAPMMIDACAGSGKTMLLIAQILVQIVTHRCSANQILGITFSHQARIDMQNRYSKDADQLGLKVAHMPYFSTFHALFYHLLIATNQLKNTSILTSYYPIQFYLSKKIIYHSDIVSDSDILQTVFQDHDQLINKGYSFDGLSIRPDANRKEIREGTNIPKLLLKVKQPDNPQEQELIANYRNIIGGYNLYKQQHGQIDFADMMILLLKRIDQNKDLHARVRKLMSQFKIVFIDEFQDISQLQWQLMCKILSLTALNHIVVIGDDDQSIYSFRGSDPEIIMNFHKNYLGSYVFNLSTNYRTGGNILHSVKPLITSNHYRLPKKLLTAHEGQGRIVECISNDRRYSANYILLLKLYQQIKNPKINNSDIAVLVHFNNSRAFVIDWLASHNCYINVSSSNYLLQNNNVYRIFIGIAKGLITNQFRYIYRYASKLGFGEYKHHINHIIDQVPKHNIRRIDSYCLLADQLNAHRRTHDTHLDKLLGNYSHRIQHPSRIYKNNLGALIWMAVDALTRRYFKYMLKNKYMSQDLLDSIRRYISRELESLSNHNDVMNFFKNEQIKVNTLLSDNTQNSINIMSLHQSKGLQFKWVYLYDLNNRQNKEKQVAINHYFAPNMSLQWFLNFLMSASPVKIHKIEKYIYGDDQTHAFTLLSSRIDVFQLQHGWKNEQIIKKVLAMNFHKNKDESAIEEQAWQMYHNVIHTSRAVEEQRRLIYVGATRAEQRLYLAYNRDADPLLNELDISNKNKYYLETNGQVLGYDLNTKYQNMLKKMRKKLQK